jgi:hypothetical protein
MGMSTVSQTDHDEIERDRKLKEAIAKALDFSEAHESLERAEKLLEETLKKLGKTS